MLYSFKTPKIQLAIWLIVIFITAFIRQPSGVLFIRFVFGILLAAWIDIILLKIRRIELFFPSASIVSACIIGLLLAPSLTDLELFLTISAAIVSKHFFRIDKKHIFNPAAFGLFFGGLVFGHDVSWWAVSWQKLSWENLFLTGAFLTLLIPGYIAGIKMRRAKIIVSFFLSYVFIIYLISRSGVVFDPTVLFFALVMLPEPMTTPVKPMMQILFGIFVAIESIFISSPVFSFQPAVYGLIPDPLITALLIGNFIFFKAR